MKNFIIYLLSTITLLLVSCNSDPINVEPNKNIIPDKSIFYNLANENDQTISIYSVNLDGTDLKLIKNDACILSNPIGNFLVYLKLDKQKNEFTKMFTSNLDGTNEKNIVTTDVISYYKVSPDSKKIAYLEENIAYLINSDGTNVIKLSGVYLKNSILSFTADSKKIGWFETRNTNDSLYFILVNVENLARKEISINNFHLFHEEIFKYDFTISSDSSKVLVCGIVNNSGNFSTQLFMIDITSDVCTQLTNDGIFKELPVISPDMKKIAYYSGACDINIMNIDGSAHEKLTSNTGNINGIRNLSIQWSSDSKQILFQTNKNEKNVDIYIGDLRLINIETKEVKIIEKSETVLFGGFFTRGIKN